MTARPRRGSLFWPIAGLYALAVVVGVSLQFLVVVTVLRPLEEREARSRAELVASGLAADLSAWPEHGWRAAEMDSILERHRATLGPGIFGFRDQVGWRITHPGHRGRMLDRLLAEEAREPRRDHRGVVVTRPVMRGTERLGEVVVVRPFGPPGGSPSSSWGATLLWLPTTLLLAALVGLIVVRMLVRRLRAMEVLAARVADGDLSVRIGDPRRDEIGRLAERLDRMTDGLAEARDRLEATEQQRRQLFADITHELATPLTSIRGYAETLSDPALPVSAEERNRYVRGVLEESRRLDRMIRDLFELARLEAGASPLEAEPLDWAALCRNTTERFQPRFRDAGLSLAWRGPASEAWIVADGHRMEQVLENLLANALRYVPAGGTVEVELGPAPERSDLFRLVVSDDGPGIAEPERSHVFERFFRAAGARGGASASDAGGSGLGLAIVREIVQRHGGAVAARGREPHGLSIQVELQARS